MTSALLTPDTDVETCVNCGAPATDWHWSISGRSFPKCAKHMEQALEADRRYRELSAHPFSGPNEFGEYYDEDSY